MNPYAFQFEVSTPRGEGRKVGYRINGQQMLLGFQNGRPVYERQFGLHFLTRRLSKDNLLGADIEVRFGR